MLMNPTINKSRSSPPSLSGLLDFLELFEQAWQEEQPPDLGEFLSSASARGLEDASTRRQLLEELVKIDLEYRWRPDGVKKVQATFASPTGAKKLPARPQIERYLALHPELAPSGQVSVDLVAEEYRVRWRFGDKPSPDIFAKRFPYLADSLPQRLALANDDLQREAGPASSVNLTSAQAETIASDGNRDAYAAVDANVQVPGYEFLGELGRGGMGVVYKARHIALRRVVALKMILRGGHASGAELERFRTEAESIARLQHPNIVQIHEVGDHEGLPFFSLEFCSGGGLDRKLAGTPLPPREAAALVEKLAHAMQAAHDKGVIHRDLKPANVLLAEDGTPKITDFGLAKKLDEAGKTQDGSVMGTPSYMAPEQAGGKSKELGPACDIYALGAILYELLTGRPPFKAATPLDTMMQVVTDEPVPPSQLQSKTPRDLETICLKCLQKVPGSRYSSALALAEDLRRFLEDRPVKARRAGQLEHAWRWCRRNRGLATLGAVVLVLGFLVVPGMLLGFNRQLSAQLLLVTTAESEEKKAKRDALEKLFLSYRDQARANRLTGRMGHRFDTLKAVAEAANVLRQLDLTAEQIEFREFELRNEAIAALALPDLRPGPDWVVGLGNPAEFSADLKWYLWRDAEHYSVRRAGDHANVFQLPLLNWGKLSPDGRYAAGGNYTAVQLWQIGDSNVILDMPCKHQAYHFSPDGKHFAFWSADEIHVFDLAKRKTIKRVACPPATHLAYHPSQPRLAASCGGQIVVVDWQEGQRLKTMSDTSSIVGVLAWHPDGRRLAAVHGEERIRLWDVDSGKSYHDIEGQIGRGISVSFAAGGDLLVTAGWSAKLRLWNPHTGKAWLTVANSHHNTIYNSQRSMLGSSFDGNKLGLREVCSSRAYRTLAMEPRHGLKQGYYLPAVSDNGSLLAVTVQDGVSLWDLETGENIAFLRSGLAASQFEKTESGSAVLTASNAGLIRWPLERNAHSWVVGRAEKLPVEGNQRFAAVLARIPDGQVFALEHESGLMLRQRDKAPRILGPPRKMNHIALSPDGQWAAVTGLKDYSVKVLRLADGAEVKEIPQKVAMSKVSFSTDGKWLLTNGDGYRLWHVGSWEPGPTWNGGLLQVGVFSPDGLLALPTEEGTIRLLNLATQKELARLENPVQERASELIFTPDGTKLIATSMDSRIVHVWDLRAIREELVNLGLDWNRPQYPAVQTPLPVNLDFGDLNTKKNTTPPSKPMPDPTAPKKKKTPPPSKPSDPMPPAPNLKFEVKKDLKSAMTEYDLGIALRSKKDFPGAIAAFRMAIKLGKNDAKTHYILGNALTDHGDVTDAIAAYREAVKLDPNLAEAHCNLGHQLRNQGMFADGLLSLKHGHELGVKRSAWKYASAQWVKTCERLIELDEKLPQILAGKVKPTNSAERLELAVLCQRYRERHLAAVRFYTDAFAADQKLIENPLTPHRHNAACAAVAAASGKDKDADKLDAKERTILRQQALDWLRADLASWGRLLNEKATDARTRTLARDRLQSRLDDKDLAAVRDEAALAKLPQIEREAWQSMWAEMGLRLADLKK